MAAWAWRSASATALRLASNGSRILARCLSARRRSRSAFLRIKSDVDFSSVRRQAARCFLCAAIAFFSARASAELASARHSLQAECSPSFLWRSAPKSVVGFGVLQVEQNLSILILLCKRVLVANQSGERIASTVGFSQSCPGLWRYSAVHVRGTGQELDGQLQRRGAILPVLDVGRVDLLVMATLGANASVVAQDFSSGFDGHYSRAPKLSTVMYAAEMSIGSRL